MVNSKAKKGLQENMKDLHYQYAGKNRDHGKHAVEGKGLERVELQKLKGDLLKARILFHFKEKLNAAENSSQLKEIVSKLKESPEYKVLETGQGWATKTFKLNTSSKQAFEKMVSEAEEKLENSPKPGM